MGVDLWRKLNIPPVTQATLRPDMDIWSEQGKEVICSTGPKISRYDLETFQEPKIPSAERKNGKRESPENTVLFQGMSSRQLFTGLGKQLSEPIVGPGIWRRGAGLEASRLFVVIWPPLLTCHQESQNSQWRLGIIWQHQLQAEDHNCSIVPTVVASWGVLRKLEHYMNKCTGSHLWNGTCCGSYMLPLCNNDCGNLFLPGNTAWW